MNGERGRPPYAHRIGVTPHPRRDARGHSYGSPEPERLPFDPRRWSSDAAWLRALELFDAGYFWEAHELFEARWRGTREPTTRALMRGLVQVCALELALAAQRARGAEALAGRAASSLRAAGATESGALAGIDVARLIAGLEQRLASATPLRLRDERG